jgi:hypothetical protein
VSRGRQGGLKGGSRGAGNLTDGKPVLIFLASGEKE